MCANLGAYFKIPSVHGPNLGVPSTLVLSTIEVCTAKKNSMAENTYNNLSTDMHNIEVVHIYACTQPQKHPK